MKNPLVVRLCFWNRSFNDVRFVMQIQFQIFYFLHPAGLVLTLTLKKKHFFEHGHRKLEAFLFAIHHSFRME